MCIVGAKVSLRLTPQCLAAEIEIRRRPDVHEWASGRRSFASACLRGDAVHGGSFRSENADLRATSATVAFDTDLRRNLRADLFGVAHHTHLASLSGFEG